MKKLTKYMLPILTSSTVLSASILVGCGQTLKADFVCNIKTEESLESNVIDTEANKTYTVAVDLGQLNHNKTFTGYRLVAKTMVGFIGELPHFNRSLCQVRIDDGEFKQAPEGEEANVITDTGVSYSKIEFIIAFKQQEQDLFLAFLDNPYIINK